MMLTRFLVLKCSCPERQCACYVATAEDGDSQAVRFLPVLFNQRLREQVRERTCRRPRALKKQIHLEFFFRSPSSLFTCAFFHLDVRQLTLDTNTPMTAPSQIPTSLTLSLSLFTLLGLISCAYCTSISLLSIIALSLLSLCRPPILPISSSLLLPDQTKVGTPKKPFCGDTSGEGPVRDRAAFDSYGPLGVLLGVGFFSFFSASYSAFPADNKNGS